MADSDEPSGDAGALRAGYERLRSAVLSGAAGGWRLGHSVLAARGMTAWMSSFGELAPLASCGTGAASPTPLSWSARFPSRADRTVSPTDAEQVVAVLAQMVLPLAA